MDALPTRDPIAAIVANVALRATGDAPRGDSRFFADTLAAITVDPLLDGDGDREDESVMSTAVAAAEGGRFGDIEAWPEEDGSMEAEFFFRQAFGNFVDGWLSSRPVGRIQSPEPWTTISPNSPPGSMGAQYRELQTTLTNTALSLFWNHFPRFPTTFQRELSSPSPC